MSGSGTDYTTTPHLGLYKPIANMAVGTWGDLWNSNADAIDSAINFASGGGPFLPLSGGTVTGNILAHGNTEAWRGSFGVQGGNPTLFDGSTPLYVADNPTYSTVGGQAVRVVGNYAGTITDTGQPQFILFQGVDAVHAPNVDSIAHIANYYTLNGSTGARIAHQTSMQVTGSADIVGANHYFQALSGGISVNGSLGGTSSAYTGAVFASNLTATLDANAKFVSGIQGLEVDVAMQAGSSATYKGAISAVLQSADAVESLYPSYAYAIGLSGDSPASLGFGHGIVWGGPNSFWPMNTSSGIMIYADPNRAAGGPAYQCASGIDFSAVTFSSAFLKSRGFLVDGSGHTSPLLANATNDAAAATAGVPVGAMYRNGNAVQVRLT